METRNYSKNRENSKVIGGLILVGVGVALLARNMGLFMPMWLFTWPTILILWGVYVGIKHNFRNNAWIVLVAVGSFFLLNKLFPYMRMEPYFWPLLIIATGLVFILRPRGGSLFRRHAENDLHPGNETGNWEGTSEGATLVTADSGTPDSNDFVRISSVFSGINRRVLSKNFQGAHVSSVFGGAEINLTQSDISGPVIIRVEIVFGGLKLIIPPHWAVQTEIDGVFHGVEDKRRLNVSLTDVNPDKKIILRGSVVFGGIEIKTY